MRALGVVLSLALVAFAMLSRCKDTPQGSTLGAYERRANFPMYYTVAGANAGEGEIYKIEAIEAGAKIKPKLVLGSLNFPTAITLDASGAIYFTETMPTPQGRVMKIAPGATEATELASGLDYPIGIAVDTFGHIYVMESGAKRVHRLDYKGNSTVFLDEEAGIGYPRAAAIDREDNMYLVELTTNVVSKVTPKGARTPLNQDLVNPSGIAFGPFEEKYLLMNNTSGSDGQLFQIKSDTELTELAGSLVNPLALAVEGTGDVYIAEGDPANRVIRISLKTGVKASIASTGVNPFGIAFTPY